MDNHFKQFLAHQSTIILDGGLATELEYRGYDLNDPLWSAKVLMEQPEAIYEVHQDYLRAGADVIITGSYQATIEGFMGRGMSESAAVDLILSAIRLAIQARDDFWADEANRVGRLRPLVAASVGPYGAYLADGSEYTGNYNLDKVGLINFHERRWELLANSGADILACETIPSFIEAQAFADLLQNTPEMGAWFSFSCRNDHDIADGNWLADCAAFLDMFSQVMAIGVNCVPPHYVPKLIGELQMVTRKPIVVYPNSGEAYDAKRKSWSGESAPEEYGTSGREWRKLGAAVIGGCCRTRPAHILALSSRLKQLTQKA